MKRLFEYVCSLNEMAVERKEYKRKLVDLQYQLIEIGVWFGMHQGPEIRT